MKKITLLLLLVYSFGFGQSNLTGTSNYKLISSVSLGIGAQGVACGIGGLQWLYVTRTSGQDFLKPNDGNSWQNTNVTFPERIFSESDLISTFRIRSNRRETYGLFDCCCQETGMTETYKPILRLQDISYVNDTPNGGVLAQRFNGTVSIKTFPIVNLKNGNLADDLVGYDDFINIPAMTGILNQYYNWQYSTNPDPVSSSWIDLPSQFQGINSLNLKTSDFLPKSLIGSTFYIRVKSNNFGSEGQGTSVKLKCLKSAPHFIDKIETPVSCFDSQDGKIKFTFDRLIEDLTRSTLSMEQLTYTLTRIDTTPPTNYPSGTVSMSSDKTFIISGLATGKYTIRLFGFYNGFSTYTSGIDHTRNFEIKKPSALQFDATASEAYCAGGNDAQIIVDAIGGAGEDEGGFYEYSLNDGSTWTAFSTKSKKRAIIEAVPQGDYIVKVRDSRKCVARIPKIINNVIVDLEATEKTIKLSTKQSKTPVNINYSFTKEPTYFGATNGIMVATISGGTPFKDTSNKIFYVYEWKNAEGTLLNSKTTTTVETGGIYKISLQDIPAGAYYLTIKDQNYGLTTQNTGCTDLANIEKILSQPSKLEIKFTIKQAISCHKDNTFGNETDNNIDGIRDQSQDGIIEAQVTGGVPFAGTANSGNPYQYAWKKLDNSNQWQPLNANTFVATNLSYGQYALNVTDANGISVGTFANGAFTPQDQTILLGQPDKFELSFSKQDVSCGAGNDGWATALPKGGVAPYKYSWSNSTGATSQNITGLTAGNYFVRVTDAKGCVVQGSINLPQPAGISIQDFSVNPNCAKGSDGSIDLKISGGKPPFTYTWNTNATTEDITNLVEGNYTVTIKDVAGCEFTHQVTLTDPSPVIVNLGADRTLCNNQSQDLNITIIDPNPTYSLTSTNGFTSNSPTVSITKAGTYYAKVITASGCVGEDEITIQTTQATVDSQFFLTSQAYLDEEVVMVNTSDPFSENTEWVIPNDVTIVSQEPKFIVLKFNGVGSKTISLKQTQGDCYALYSKNINVEERSSAPNSSATNIPFIKDFIVTPNPSNGQFKAVVNLQQINPIKLRLYSYSGQSPIIQKSESGKKNYVVDFDLALAGGTYVLVLETTQQTLIRKIIVF